MTDAKQPAAEKEKPVELKISAESVEAFDCASCEKSIPGAKLRIFSETTCPHCQSNQVVPGRMGQFLLYNLLGRGAISVVFRAIDTESGKSLALKVSHKLGRKPTEFYDDYLLEAKATSFIRHPNIIEVYDYGFTNGYPFIAMEIISGGTLKDLIKDNVFLDEPRALKFAREVSEGLQAAALAGIIHGDLKPANILLQDATNRFKIVDFGNFNTKGGEPDENMKIFGTPYYIAPEKVQHKTEDMRSDIYSLGATLWHAVSGYPPHDGKDVKEVVRAHINEQIPDVQHANPTISDATANLIRKMMAPKPDDRFQDYAELISAIDKAMTKLENPPNG